MICILILFYDKSKSNSIRFENFFMTSILCVVWQSFSSMLIGYRTERFLGFCLIANDLKSFVIRYIKYQIKNVNKNENAPLKREKERERERKRMQ